MWLLKQARGYLASKKISPSLDERGAPRQAIESRRSVIFVTVYPRPLKSQLEPAVGFGESIHWALKSALDAASASAAGETPGKAGPAPAPERIQIDVLDGDFIPIVKPNEAASAAKLISVGEEGIAVETARRVHYILPSAMIYNAIVVGDGDNQTGADLLDRAVKRLGLAASSRQSPEVKLSRFRTLSFVENQSHTAALRVVRGATPVKEVDRARLVGSARAGGDYLVRAQKPDGSFHYFYFPVEDEYSSPDYNILRHAGTALSLFDLYGATRDLHYLEAARRAVNFLKTRFRPAAPQALLVLDDDGKAKLGANGLALIALARQMELDPKSADREAAAQLANLILAMQRKDGSFADYYLPGGKEPQAGASLYYPGEALCGLMQLFNQAGDKRLLDAARRGADYLIEAERKMASLPPDAWLMQALEALFKTDPQRRYAEHAIAIAEAMIAEQYTDSDAAEFPGAFGPGLPRAAAAATRSEGMIAAYRMARSINDPRAARIANALKAAARFQLSQQFNADNSFFLPNAGRAAGGFRAGLTSTQIRIDYVQHNISSLVAVAQTLY